MSDRPHQTIDVFTYYYNYLAPHPIKLPFTLTGVLLHLLNAYVFLCKTTIDVGDFTLNVRCVPAQTDYAINAI